MIELLLFKLPLAIELSHENIFSVVIRVIVDSLSLFTIVLVRLRVIVVLLI